MVNPQRVNAQTLTVTRVGLHGVAELLLAGPQYRRSGTIRLRPAEGGFATTREPALAVDLDALVAGGRTVARLSGRTYAQLAEAAGVEPGAPEGLYVDGSGADPADVVEVDPRAAQVIARAFADGEAALRRLAPGETPVLWPEHFDLGITVAEVNYGVSPGDAYLPEPYAYVGPWATRRGPFWNAPFGAARPLTSFAGADELAEFLAEGRERAAHG